MPCKTNGKGVGYKTKHLNEISNLQTTVEEKFNLIENGKFKKRYMVIGMPLGMLLGLPFGAAIGGIGLIDKKAKNENRIL